MIFNGKKYERDGKRIKNNQAITLLISLFGYEIKEVIPVSLGP